MLTLKCRGVPGRTELMIVHGIKVAHITGIATHITGIATRIIGTAIATVLQVHQL
jgi:hypothetical protein